MRSALLCALSAASAAAPAAGASASRVSSAGEPSAEGARGPPYGPPWGLVAVTPFASETNVTLRLRVITPAGYANFGCSIRDAETAEEIWNGTTQMQISAPGGCEYSPEGCEARMVATPKVKPRPWNLTHPALYSVNCSFWRGGHTREPAATPQGHGPPPPPPQAKPWLESRFGFRSFTASGGRFLLNGRPIFLRGNSINPPGRSLPSVSATRQFALDYMRHLKKHAHVNAMRIGDGVSASTAPWYDAADEVGMLIYAGPYSNP